MFHKNYIKKGCKSLIVIIIFITIYAAYSIYSDTYNFFELSKEKRYAQRQLSDSAIALSNEIKTASQISSFNLDIESPIHQVTIQNDTSDGIGRYYLIINTQKFGPFKYALFYVSNIYKNLTIELINFNNSSLKENITIELDNWDNFIKTEQFTDRYGYPIGFTTLYYTK